MQTTDIMEIHAYCLWDASIVFPEPLRTGVRSKFRNSLTRSKAYITELSLAGHEGIESVAPESADHYWYQDLDSGAVVGDLPKALVSTFRMLAAEANAQQAVRLAGRLAHLCIDAYVSQHLIEHTDGFIVRSRVLHDVKAHLMEMPFVWDGITEGETFQLLTPFTDTKAIELTLGNEGWSKINIQVSNCYLYGNGWPAAKPLLQKCYNRACNELAKAVLIARGNK